MNDPPLRGQRGVEPLRVTTLLATTVMSMVGGVSLSSQAEMAPA